MRYRRFSFVLLIVALLWMSVAAAQQDPAQLANAVMENRQKSQMEMRQYSWHTRTEIVMGGESKSVKTEMVRYTADGEMQREGAGRRERK